MHQTTPSQTPRQRLQRALYLFCCLLLSAPLLTGCGSLGLSIASQSLVLTPSAATLQVGEKLSLQISGAPPSTPCSWSSSNPSALPSLGDRQFLAHAPGRASVTAKCGDLEATSAIVVSTLAGGPLVITRGGTYTGSWSSNDPDIPAVQIQTSDPVTLQNATITSRGDLISVPASTSGSTLTVQNVTGIAYDPGVAGLQRGSFLTAENIRSLTVQHCSMYGVRFGVKLLSSTAEHITVTENLAQHLEDRESDGQGGFLDARPDLGHFLMLNRVDAPQGAEIAWNEFQNTLGSDSTEDVINLYKSQGSPSAPIAVHDNYIEGNASPSAPGNYTGAGLIADGDATAPETAFVTFTENQIVHTAGSGIEIANGHHIAASNNRIVSCGRTHTGAWYAAPFRNAIVVWNFYAAPEFGNLTVTNTTGGMLRPDAAGNPQIADLWFASQDINASDTLDPNLFTDPCLLASPTSPDPEAAERTFWTTKLAQGHHLVGDQHTP